MRRVLCAHMCFGPALATRGHIRASAPVLLVEGQAWLWKSVKMQIQEDSSLHRNENPLPEIRCVLGNSFLQRKISGKILQFL